MGNRKCGGSLPCRQRHRGVVPHLRRGRGTEHNADRQGKIKRGGAMSVGQKENKKAVQDSGSHRIFRYSRRFFACFLVKEIL